MPGTVQHAALFSNIFAQNCTVITPGKLKYKLFAVLLIVFNSVITIAPACALESDGNSPAFSILNQNLQSADITVEVPAATVYVASRFTTSSKQLPNGLKTSQNLREVKTAENHCVVAQNSTLPKPDYYAFVFHYALF